MELICSVMKYDWGKLGQDSLVARLAEKNDPNFIMDNTSPYAELWMGTHPNGHSVLKANDVTLFEYITNNPSCLGDANTSFGMNLSFLFKVLSVRKALSVQVHPNKEDAHKLHMKFPREYPDNNHKPELAIALTKFDALCGFRPLEEIADFMKKIPEFFQLMDAEECQNFIKGPTTKLLEQCFRSYITASVIDARKCAARLIDRFSDTTFEIKKRQLADLFIELNKQFPGDIGLFSIYFLNHITLESGEAIFLKAGLPHAYLQGDCIEVMARSDNVVRAGLTPKLRDVTTLLEIVEYSPVSTENLKFKGRYFDKYVQIYKPPIQDFAVSRICVPANETYQLPILNCASIIIVICGRGECEQFEMKPGTVSFIPNRMAVQFNTNKEGITIFQAYSNV